MKQRWNDVEQSSKTVISTLCINVVQSWKSDVGFSFIFNVGSRLFQRWSTMLKQHWCQKRLLSIGSEEKIVVNKAQKTFQKLSSKKLSSNFFKEGIFVWLFWHFFRFDGITFCWTFRRVWLFQTKAWEKGQRYSIFPLSCMDKGMS